MVSLEALNATECLPILGDLDREPTKVEMKEGHGKARGQDGNPLPVLEGGKVSQ